MKTHPVPQNILDVEFKLFGSFTLKQFGKIVVGCMFGVLFFLLPVNVIIKFPLIGVSVAIGVLSAIIPTFQIWIVGFVKALFISPRYVWIKDEVKSDIFKNRQVDPQKAQALSASKNSKKINIEDIPLDQIFTTRKERGSSVQASDVKTQSDQVKQDNFSRIYNDFFNLDVKNASGTTKPSKQIQDTLTPNEKIKQLQLNLQMLKKDDPDLNQKQESIMAQINELRAQLTQNRYTDEVQSQRIVSAQGESLAPDGQVVFGVVVNSKNEGVSNAAVSLVAQNLKQEFRLQTDPNGRFATTQKLPQDTYTVSIKHPTYRFHTYKFTISAQPLPAYKFKAR